MLLLRLGRELRPAPTRLEELRIVNTAANLPNVMYGDWESAVYGHDSRLTEEEKSAKRKAQLKTY